MNYESNLVPNAANGETGNRIIGNDHDNVIQGNGHDDYIFGGNGNDDLLGLGGNDVLSGGAGNDRLDGGSGNDHLYGNTGNNVMWGGAGNDTFYGGDQNDQFVFTESQGGVDRVSSSFGADAGHDTLHLTDIAVADIRFYYADNGKSLHITSAADAADGSLDSGVIIEDYFATPGLGLVDVVYGFDGGLVI